MICWRPRDSQSSRVVWKHEKERGSVPDRGKKGRERQMQFHQHRFGSCSFSLVANQPLSEQYAADQEKKRPAQVLKNKCQNLRLEGLCQHYQSRINKCFLWLSRKWMHGKITAWHGEQEIQPLPAVMLLYLEFIINECVLKILCELEFTLEIEMTFWIAYTVPQKHATLFSLKVSSMLHGFLSSFCWDFLLLFGDVCFGFFKEVNQQYRQRYILCYIVRDVANRNLWGNSEQGKFRAVQVNLFCSFLSI